MTIWLQRAERVYSVFCLKICTHWAPALFPSTCQMGGHGKIFLRNFHLKFYLGTCVSLKSLKIRTVSAVKVLDTGSSFETRSGLDIYGHVPLSCVAPMGRSCVQKCRIKASYFRIILNQNRPDDPIRGSWRKCFWSFNLHLHIPGA
jgi:hypothetical protein